MTSKRTSKRLLAAAREEMRMDMTPMIDCVFLLMIFFVLVIDLGQKDLEDLVLPKAEYSLPDEDPPTHRPVVNVMQDGRVKFRGDLKFDPHDPELQGPERLADLMRFFRDHFARRERIRPERDGAAGVTLIDEPILIRADKWTQWQHVGRLFEGAMTQDATFWKLELALSDVDREQTSRRR